MNRNEGKLKLKETLAEVIREAGGRISFARYMELCLYHPSEGYYQSARGKLGKSGDFYTSAHIGAAMGQCIAVQLAEAAARLGAPGMPITVLEWGGGDGRLAKAVLDELRSRFPELYDRIRFIGVENAPLHRAMQAEALHDHRFRLAAITASDDPVVTRTLGEELTLVYANELLDAFPVHRLQWSEGRWKEIFVAWDRSCGAPVEAYGDISEPAVAELLRQHGVSGKSGQIIEVSAAALDWISRLGASMREGFVLLADYGDVTEALIAPHRMNGTLLCYRNHLAADNPYEYMGEQDMTAHVNFEWCMESSARAGFEDVRLRTQKQFLVDQGILYRLQAHDGTDPFSPEARVNRAIRQLLLSDGMSELFKVLTMFKRTRSGT